MSITTTQRPATMDEIAAEMDRRGEVIEKLEAERDAAQARSVSRGKHLRKLRDRLILIRDEIADEGDRVYFGSTNHADDFRELVQELDDFHWDRIMEERDERDVIADCRAANERARTAESDLAAEVDRRVAAEAEIERLSDQLTHEQFCRLSRAFGETADLSINSPDHAINEWLKRRIAEAQA